MKFKLLHSIGLAIALSLMSPSSYALPGISHNHNATPPHQIVQIKRNGHVSLNNGRSMGIQLLKPSLHSTQSFSFPESSQDFFGTTALSQHYLISNGDNQQKKQNVTPAAQKIIPAQSNTAGSFGNGTVPLL